MTEIRGLIIPKDLDRFDAEVMSREVMAMKVRRDSCAHEPCHAKTGFKIFAGWRCLIMTIDYRKFIEKIAQPYSSFPMVY